ncbi:hypothetical protein KHQ08_07135 [Pseudochrobactrum algeriensis]|uniref:hypothetical protein n=1 Tax=Pseudochrobactrum algeriensis TaxID=2834768 RepID=UPI001BCD4D07|nr:hypothetical protein [Pseudochrobactrum algeriensis]QVQ37787.1 hypothetical protein KHQ08_07135 [Pseudochrobactrum algeriensis]QVQ41008.1 hypothetical protein KHQ07_05435 [Pseudochrobactrum algeriensis]QVQ44932.1 hypothetical protein KHQ09_07400 [Pseudochrobactrum algeriensis]
MEKTSPTPQAISGVADTRSIRVLLLANGQQVHAPLDGLLKPLTDRITELEARLAAAGL